MLHVIVVVFNQSIKEVKIPGNKTFQTGMTGKGLDKIIIDNFKSSGPME